MNNSGSEQSYNLEHFFELSPALMIIAGFDGYFKKVNPAVSKALGYSHEELLQQPINDFIHPDDQVVTSKYRDNIRNGIPLMNFENRYVTKSGDVVWLSWTSMPFFEEEIVYAIAKNVTHKKKIEEDRNALLANLTKINNDLKQLTYTTSHDLRSPVGNLLSVFSFLDVERIQDSETAEFMHMLKTATEGLKHTLNNYVDSISTDSNLTIKTEVIVFEDAYNAVIKSLESLVMNSNTLITTDFFELEEVVFNRSYLESIFLNLISNSIKYARPEARPEIHIKSRNQNGVKQLIFDDNGLGFDLDKVRDKVFGLHQKFHDHADSKGIGLYLVYNHITSLGGHITLESTVNEGSKFIITFK